ncbi:hypothetical protein [Sorangium sp. So ce363]|uniref:hypothetical protein n=1 Tax=Sorangium sp. So ce363 TaxID=3133304 RepID=UPI003F606265
MATSSDATLDDLAVQLARRDHIVASRHTVGRALRRLNITRKKKRSTQPSATRKM